jgi:acyl carrier protein
VKIRGYRIELGEIEAALNACDGIAESAVLAIEDNAGTKRLVAYVVPKGGVLNRGSVSAALAARLPEHMLPTALIALDAMPLTTNGKIDRAVLPYPGPDDAARQPYVAPETTAEKTLAEIWSQLLKIDRVGTADNFFALGGDSLLATEMAVRLGKRLGTPVSLARFFERPVLADFARSVSQLQ